MVLCGQSLDQNKFEFNIKEYIDVIFTSDDSVRYKGFMLRYFIQRNDISGLSFDLD